MATVFRYRRWKVTVRGGRFPVTLRHDWRGRLIYGFGYDRSDDFVGRSNDIVVPERIASSARTYAYGLRSARRYRFDSDPEQDKRYGLSLDVVCRWCGYRRPLFRHGPADRPPSPKDHARDAHGQRVEGEPPDEEDAWNRDFVQFLAFVYWGRFN